MTKLDYDGNKMPDGGGWFTIVFFVAMLVLQVLYSNMRN